MNLRHRLAGRAIARMNGAGNKILVLDLRGSSVAPTPEEARAIHRAPGLDYDQMMVLSDPRRAGTAAYVRIYNNDGTLAGACGNGARCVADRLCREFGAEAVDVETEAGRHRLRAARSLVLSGRHGRAAARLGGNSAGPRRPGHEARPPFLGRWRGAGRARPRQRRQHGQSARGVLRPDLARIDAAAWGPKIEVHPMFPEKANVTFAQINARDDVTARVWERGVGLTLACGSAACATLVAASRLDLMERKGIVRLPGGELAIEWRSSDDHVLMTGPVEYRGRVHSRRGAVRSRRSVSANASADDGADQPRRPRRCGRLRARRRP